MVWKAPATACSDMYWDNSCNSYREELPAWRKKILCNAGAVCFCHGKEETFFSWLPEFFSLYISRVWASECWSNLVHVMGFTQLDCQHKQAQAYQRRKRWKMWHIIKTYLQIYLIFLPHWQTIMHQLSYWVDQDTSEYINKSTKMPFIIESQPNYSNESNRSSKKDSGCLLSKASHPGAWILFCRE